MTHTEQVIANAQAVVASIRSERERDAERRKRVFGKLDVSRPLPTVRGQQLTLDLQSPQLLTRSRMKFCSRALQSWRARTRYRVRLYAARSIARVTTQQMKRSSHSSFSSVIGRSRTRFPVA